MGMIVISGSTNLLSRFRLRDKKIRVMNVFFCMLLALASQKERKQRWIIHHVLNFILNEFLPSFIHSSCWMQDAKFGRNIRLSKVCFD